MSLKAKLEQILHLAEAVSQPLGLLVVDARFSQMGQRHSLEVTIFRPDGRIGLEDCEKVSHQLEELLDSYSPPLIEGYYVLEIQSPGIDRQLKTEREFLVFTGHTVEIKARENIPGLGSVFKGTLLTQGQGRITIGNPQTLEVSAKPRSPNKNQLPENSGHMDSLEVDLSKLIQVRLYSEELHARRGARRAHS